MCTDVFSLCSWLARAFWTGGCIVFKSHLFCVFTSYIHHGKPFLHYEKMACVVTLNKLLGLSQEFWATVTDLMQAGEGHLGFYLPRPKGTEPLPLHRVWEELWVLPPWGSENVAISRARRATKQHLSGWQRGIRFCIYGCSVEQHHL